MIRRISWFLLALVFFAPVMAFASVAGEIIASPAGQNLITGLLGLLAAAATWALNSIRRKFDADRKRTKFENAMERVLNLVDLVGGKLYHALEDDVRLALADGKVSDEELKALADEAMNELYKLLGPDGVKEISAAIGIPLGGFGAWIVNLILKRVFGIKIPQPVPAAEEPSTFTDAG